MRPHTSIIKTNGLLKSSTKTRISQSTGLNERWCYRKHQSSKYPIIYPYRSCLFTRYTLLSSVVSVVDERERICSEHCWTSVKSHWLQNWFRSSIFSLEKNCDACNAYWSVGYAYTDVFICEYVWHAKKWTQKSQQEMNDTALNIVHIRSEGEQILLTFFPSSVCPRVYSYTQYTCTVLTFAFCFRYASVNMSGIMAKAARRRRLMNFCLIITTTTSTDNGSRQISSCGRHFSRLLMNSFRNMTFVTSPSIVWLFDLRFKACGEHWYSETW